MSNKDLRTPPTTEYQSAPSMRKHDLFKDKSEAILNEENTLAEKYANNEILMGKTYDIAVYSYQDRKIKDFSNESHRDNSQ